VEGSDGATGSDQLAAGYGREGSPCAAQLVADSRSAAPHDVHLGAAQNPDVEALRAAFSRRILPGKERRRVTGMTTEEQYPQPHEGVRGLDLAPGHPLSLDEASVDRRLEMLERVRQRWNDILHDRIPDRDHLFDVMYDPHPGDMVLELTTSFRTDRDSRVLASGILLVHERKEWASTDEEWAQTVAQEKASHEEDGYSFDEEQFAKDRFATSASYVQYGPSPTYVCRWSNCKFIVIPMDLAEPFIRPFLQAYAKRVTS
jgi:hypothetical protein